MNFIGDQRRLRRGCMSKPLLSNAYIKDLGEYLGEAIDF